MTRPLPRFLGFLATLLLVGCAAEDEHSDWPTVKQWVRDEFAGAPTVTVAELHAQLEDPSTTTPVLLDARAPEEFAVSHLPGAVNAPGLEEAQALLEGIDPDTAVVVYCSIGYRSGAMTEELVALGFTNTHNLEGSIFEWANADLPVVRDGETVHEVHPFDAEWGRLLHRELWPPGW